MPKTNRDRRRHPEGTNTTPRSPRAEPNGEQGVRAKSSGHGKKTADKWNQ